MTTSPSKTNNDSYMFTCGDDMPNTLQSAHFVEEVVEMVEVVRAFRECAFIERKVVL